jgi:phosphopantothenoylcysteine decarboxylase/phosphopantothenate--cysteine ligase
MFPRGRKLLLGVGGGISAYKSCDLLRRLQDEGFIVDVVPTKNSLNFVGKATWQALSGRKVLTDLWSDTEDVSHIKMAKENDLIVIAPATADLISRLATGRADDLLTNIVLASTATKFLVPAMHPEMWNNIATVENVELLRKRDFVIIEPDEGRMTGNDFGVGRYPESQKIINHIMEKTNLQSDLKGYRILITAGGTREPIDPIRYIGNRSSGKQGYAIASAAASRGAKVHLVAANTELPMVEGIEFTRVETAEEMAAVVNTEYSKSDALIMSAAVADAKVKNFSSKKIRKDELNSIPLENNPDILKSIVDHKNRGQIVIGFAAETCHNSKDLIAAGLLKLHNKSLDYIYVNDVSNGSIFGDDFTEGYLLGLDHDAIKVPRITKETLSDILLDKLSIKLESIHG